MTVRNGLILMTALPPTIGHKYLIQFAEQFLRMQDSRSKIYVLLNTRSFEPIGWPPRFEALSNLDPIAERIEVRLCNEDNVPQKPEDHPDFWNYWKALIRKYTPNKPGDLVFASETYGKKLAEVLECEFVPCDIGRHIIETSGTAIRENPVKNFHLMLPEIQTLYKKTVTIFGPESVGKTTMTKKLHGIIPSYHVPEYARDYLEQNGAEVTDKKMLDIFYGQYTSQKIVGEMKDRPFIFQDTDLLSTLGYYKLWKGEWPRKLEPYFAQTKSDLYILMNDQIPFTPDMLRYGGDKRETKNEFWSNLLDQFGCNYYVVKETDHNLQLFDVIQAVINNFYETCKLKGFVRD
jgi:HTH-type transcriptional regulator, transcriptional repressor of NAD biosynthesis genes